MTDWRDCPAWLAVAAMLASAFLIPMLGDDFWEQGWGPALALGTMAAIALLARRITLDVFGFLIATSLAARGVMLLFDADGTWVSIAGSAAMIGVAYLVGDRPAARRGAQAPCGADRPEGGAVTASGSVYARDDLLKQERCRSLHG